MLFILTLLTIISGWVREVIYERNEDGTLSGKAKEVVYHAPLQAGSKSRTFKSPAELRPYCKFLTRFALIKNPVLYFEFYSGRIPNIDNAQFLVPSRSLERS